MYGSKDEGFVDTKFAFGLTQEGLRTGTPEEFLSEGMYELSVNAYVLGKKSQISCSLYVPENGSVLTARMLSDHYKDAVIDSTPAQTGAFLNWQNKITGEKISVFSIADPNILSKFIFDLRFREYFH